MPDKSARSDAARELIRSVAGSFPSSHEAFHDREKALDRMSSQDFPLLIEGLCAEAGPGGMANEQRNFFNSALKKWWSMDRDAVIRWLKDLPPGPTKRFLATKILSDLLLPVDPRQVQSLVKDFKAQDPGWDYAQFNDSVLDYSIQQAWKNPQVTAEQMLELYAQVSRGNSTSFHNVSIYPEGFDFRKFMDGISSMEGDDGNLSLMPGDTLEAWAKLDPQAAATWFVETSSKGSKSHISSPMFFGWQKIADAVAAANGTEGYYRWAAEVFQGSNENFLRQIAWNAKEADIVGVANAIQDTAARDRILGLVAGGSDITHAGRYLGLMSSPEARLQTIRDNRHKFNFLIKELNLDTSALQQLGLTKEQIDSALSGKR